MGRDSRSPALAIRQAIGRLGSIPFSTYMRIALYGPGGYYSRGEGIGRDFTTSPEIHPAFGAAIAWQVRQCFQLVGRPSRFDIVEIGAGRGSLARSLLDAIADEDPACLAAIRYTIVERSPGLRRVQQDRLADHRVIWSRLPSPIHGLVLSNELFDALPVRLLVQRDRLMERRVSERGGRFVFVEEYAPAAVRRLNHRELAHDEEAEVSSAASTLLRRIGRSIQRGWHLAIDYGSSGGSTLASLRQGRWVDDPLDSPGSRDLTAHVDFDALIAAGDATGLTTIGLTTQRAFLRNLGWDGFTAGIETRPLDSATLAANRDALRRIVSPAGLGSFQVLAQAKNVDEPLDGFGDNPRRWQRIAARRTLRLPLLEGIAPAAREEP